MKFERVLTDSPIREIHNRLSLLSSFGGAYRLIQKQAPSLYSRKLILKKSEGLAFTAKTALEFLRNQNYVSETARSLNQYYALLNLMSSILIANSDNELTLFEIENIFKKGHGLMNLYKMDAQANEEIEDPFENELLAFLPDGFITRYLSQHGYSLKNICSSRRYECWQKIPQNEINRFFSIKEIVSRIPELKNIYTEIFHDQPNYLHITTQRHGDELIDLVIDRNHNTVHLTEENILDILELTEHDLHKNLTFRKNKSDGDQFVLENLNPKDVEYINGNIHYSIMANNIYIKPLVGISDYLIYPVLFLYCISIWVRYRPALWREIHEGNYDFLLPLVQGFMDVVDRVVTNEVLNRIYGRRILFAPPAYFS